MNLMVVSSVTFSVKALGIVIDLSFFEFAVDKIRFRSMSQSFLLNPPSTISNDQVNFGTSLEVNPDPTAETEVLLHLHTPFLSAMTFKLKVLRGSHYFFTEFQI